MYYQGQEKFRAEAARARRSDRRPQEVQCDAVGIPREDSKEVPVEAEAAGEANPPAHDEEAVRQDVRPGDGRKHWVGIIHGDGANIGMKRESFHVLLGFEI